MPRKRKDPRIKVIVLGDHNAVVPETYDLSNELTDVTELSYWVERMRELHRTMDNLDRYLMIYDDGDGNLCLASLPKALEVVVDG